MSLPSLGLALVLSGCLAGASAAQQEADPRAEDHEQLRGLLAAVREAVNARDLRALEPHMHTPFSATMIDQAVLTTPDEMQAYFDRLFVGEDALIASLTMSPVADTLTEIYDDRFGVVRGGNTEVYELTNGRAFTLESRWTATVIKDGDRWKLLAIHNGVNFADNPVLAFARRLSLYVGAGGLAVGLLLGWLAGRLRARGRVTPSSGDARAAPPSAG